MTLDEEIGQMVMGGYFSVAEIAYDIQANHLGGAILFASQMPSVAQAQENVRTLKDAAAAAGAKAPLLIAVDQEGGGVVRIPPEMGTFESALTIGNRVDTAAAYESGAKISKALKQLGINTDLAPVLDVFSNPTNTVIADRAFGITPDRVALIAVPFMNGVRSEGILATGKHFPGHGDTSVDSHTGLPVVTKSVDQLMGFEFVPFKVAIDGGVDMIMTAHIVLEAVDDAPSTLSRAVVTGLLRERLGFQGVVITDDLAMAAIADEYTVADAAVRAIDAGCDIVLVSGPGNPYAAIAAIKTAVADGRLSRARIDESVARILRMKQRIQ
jgi:beta-N-acetylhexosaminidase